MKLSRDVLMKVGIVAAVLLILWLVYRSRACSKDGYAEFVPDDEYAENMYEERPADYAEEGQEQDLQDPHNYALMESTLDDDQANALFEPEM